jgi:restriction system protein
MGRRRHRARRKASKQEPIITLALLAVGGLVLIPGALSNNDALLLIVLLTGLLLGAALAGFAYYQQRRKQQALSALELSDIDGMDGVSFERYVGVLLTQQGYKVAYTSTSGDYGIDIIAAKDHTKTAIQIKRSAKPMGINAVQQAVAGATHYKCQKAMVVTNNTFTRSAQNLAVSNHCELIDRIKLGELVLAFQNGERR